MSVLKIYKIFNFKFFKMNDWYMIVCICILMINVKEYFYLINVFSILKV